MLIFKTLLVFVTQTTDCKAELSRRGEPRLPLVIFKGGDSSQDGSRFFFFKLKRYAG